MKSSIFLKSFFSIAVPVFFGLSYIILLRLVDHKTADHILHENGPYEIVQFITISAAFLIYVGTLRGISREDNKPLYAWVAIAALCSFYVAGEEISWGQQFFKWGTPQEWIQINDHGETNLHNTSQIFDQIPKTILEISIYVGGIIIPLLAKFKPSFLPAKFSMVYPTRALAATALALLFFRISKPLDDDFRWFDYQRLSEVKENIMYYFVFLYAVLLKSRLIANKKAAI